MLRRRAELREHVRQRRRHAGVARIHAKGLFVRLPRAVQAVDGSPVHVSEERRGFGGVWRDSNRLLRRDHRLLQPALEDVARHQPGVGNHRRGQRGGATKRRRRRVRATQTQTHVPLDQERAGVAIVRAKRAPLGVIQSARRVALGRPVHRRRRPRLGTIGIRRREVPRQTRQSGRRTHLPRKTETGGEYPEPTRVRVRVRRVRHDPAARVSSIIVRETRVQQLGVAVHAIQREDRRRDTARTVVSPRSRAREASPNARGITRRGAYPRRIDRGW